MLQIAIVCFAFVLFVCCKLCVVIWCLWFLVIIVLDVWCLFGYLHFWGELVVSKLDLVNTNHGGQRNDYMKRSLVQEAKLSTWNLVVVYMWLLIIGLKFFWLSLQVRIVSSIDGGRMPLGSYLYVLVKLTTFHYAMSCDGGNKGSKIDYRGRD